MIKSFKLGAVNWKVKIDNDRLEDLNSFGLCEYGKNLISIRNSEGNQNYSEDSIEQTLYHEVIHAILYTMHRYELSKDEEFVQVFSTLLHQFEKTKSSSK